MKGWSVKVKCWMETFLKDQRRGRRMLKRADVKCLRSSSRSSSISTSSARNLQIFRDRQRRDEESERRTEQVLPVVEPYIHTRIPSFVRLSFPAIDHTHRSHSLVGLPWIIIKPRHRHAVCPAMFLHWRIRVAPRGSARVPSIPHSLETSRAALGHESCPTP